MSRTFSIFLRSAIRAFLVGAILLPAAAAHAADTIETSYSVDVAGATLMKIRYSATLDGNRYNSKLSVKTSGMAKMLSEYRMDLYAAGHQDRDAFRPATFEYNRKKKGKWKSTALSFAADGALANPAEDVEGDAKLALLLKSSVMDPLTALLRIGAAQRGNPCSGKHRVFDGRDLFDIELVFAKKVTLASAGDAPAVECRLNYIPVAGRSVKKGETEIETYGLWLAPVEIPSAGGAIYTPVRITGRLHGMTFVAKSNVVKVNGAPAIQ